MKILLIERNHKTMSQFKGVLTENGYDVYTAWNQGDDEGEAGAEYFQGLIMVYLSDTGKTQLQIMQEIRTIPEFSLAPIMFCGSEQTAENLARLLFDDCSPFLPSALSKQDYSVIVSHLSGFLLREAA